MVELGTTGLQVFPLCLGGSVFGWACDRDQSFAVLDAYAAAGGNFIDTADMYTQWVPGNQGGESESIIGEWMRARKNRAQMVIATKVGMRKGFTTLDRQTIRFAIEGSLQRLGTDYIDLYYAHTDDPSTPLEETLGGFNQLSQDGLARHIGASNYSATRLDAAAEVSRTQGLARYEVLQPRYNLLDRGYETDIRDVCERHQIACVPFYGLARGFLTGKYRPGKTVDSVRTAGAMEYMDDRGLRVLDALDNVAAAHASPLAAVALAWLAAQSTVTTPIASARTPKQLGDLIGMNDVSLSDDEMTQLNNASNINAVVRGQES